MPHNPTNGTDEFFMRRCIQLALNAEGATYPNPMVGSVVVCDGIIIGEGWHRKAGQPHAEVNAINSVSDKALLSRSTIYVTLEPCAHHGRTPPCADMIVRMGIPRVVIGCGDSFAKVNGKGVQILRDAGCDVTVGVLEDECRWLNRRFFTVHEKGRPYVILKWAESSNGAVARLNECGCPEPTPISNQECMRFVHKQRTTEDGILVGGRTARIDNPRLTARLWDAHRQPQRYVVSPSAQMPCPMRMACEDGTTTIIDAAQSDDEGAVKHIAIPFEPGCEVAEILKVALEAGTQSLIVEGGSETLQRFIDQGEWDEAYVFVSDKVVEPKVPAPQFESSADRIVHMGNCRLMHHTRQGSMPALFEP